MGTICYFEENVKDDADGEVHQLEIGTSGYGGNGPQLYLNLNGESVLLSHADAKKFCEAVDGIAGYFGYRK
ncbi:MULTISPECIES: hypothetical protein [unclassified Rhizobium]|uniref:hypothetical protein n=1 Tax=unclassified Rhizobium TaxID=2613769 RepID=UPI001ADC3F3D|nr:MULTISPECIES: hypothetical protein [unclassified Rhizobium]MBO9122514.1 hypothetical protein [Rhizobium sp. 16-488-2b]MBO9173045.1 hypothetical protein [Rhizobium sp. 16-488-2a]